MLERFETRIQDRGVGHAKCLFILDVLRLFRPGLIRSISETRILNHYAMYRNYFKIGWRSLIKNKGYSLINILGLAVGMGICLVIYQYIHFELSYDKFHSDFQHTYRIMFDKTQNGVGQGPDPYVGYAVGVRAKEEIPGIKQYVRLHKYQVNTIVTNPDNNKAFHEDGQDLLFVDSAFLQVFDFPLKLGSKESVFDEKFNIVISEKYAEKYFGTSNPIGKTLRVSTRPSPGDYKVTGVLEKLPANSSLQFDFLLPMENYLELAWGGAVMKNSDGWSSWLSFVTYVTIDESVGLDVIGKKFDQLITKYNGARNAQLNVVEKTVLQPIADIHLRSDDNTNERFVTNTGSVQDVQVFSIIAFSILFIAWVNYINLSTARSVRRAKEVGIRKSIGALRKQLIGQFIIESFWVNFSSAIIAIGIALFTLPILGQIVGKELAMNLLHIPLFWTWFVSAVIFGSLLSGLYPAFVLSSFKPVSMLGSNYATGIGNVNFRRALITFQFLTSLLLISGTYLVYKQIIFMKNQQLGINVKKILVLKGPNTDRDIVDLQSRFQIFKDELTSHHSIADVAGSIFIPGQVNNTEISDLRKLGQPESEAPYGRAVPVGLDFPETFGFEFVAGDSFTPDMSDYEFAIINEEAVVAYGLGSPENAIQEIMVSEEGQVRIIGVVKNFHWHSLRDAQTPYVFVLEALAHSYISCKMNLSNIPESIAHIESKYNSFFPDNPFEYFFLEDQFNEQYQADIQFGSLFFAFASLAIFIACIGLFALVSYSATLRTKEIGIRKVLGANIINLMMLLSKEYLVLLLIAIVLAVPLTLYWGRAWLDNYAFRANLGIESFLIPGIILMIISLLTVSYQTYAAAKENPVESLHSG